MTAEQLKDVIIKYGNDIYSFCCYLTADRYLAEDLYQDVFLKAMEKKESLTCPENSEQTLKEIKNYLIGMAIRIWKNEKRKQFRRKGSSLDKLLEQGMELVGKDDLETMILSKEKSVLVNQQIDKLPERYRFVIMMYYMAEMSVKEIAKELKLPEGTIKSRMYKAKNMIMKGLKVNGYEE